MGSIAVTTGTVHVPVYRAGHGTGRRDCPEVEKAESTDALAQASALLHQPPEHTHDQVFENLLRQPMRR